ncbi:hypothetical protein COO60DRAFT_203752 [Scenedesmus sp. NREL 46B-D3]|nr:hypothetical protein COO60DRAFT_203752 [Scenedesmus sp. NREL 46B-D3]
MRQAMLKKMRSLAAVALVVGLALATAAAGSPASEAPLSTPAGIHWPVSVDTDLLADVARIKDNSNEYKLILQMSRQLQSLLL